MTSEQIRLVLTIADTGSISNAAKRLYLTQPTVSGTLAALEREIGCTLFLRSNHGVTPTAEGMEFLRSARRIAQELDGIARLNQQGPICRLHLTSFNSTRVERAFTQFCLNHQQTRRLDISYETQSCSVERAAILIYDGKTDMVLTIATDKISDAQRQLLASRHLTYDPIGQMPVAITMAASHPLCQGDLTLERVSQFTRLTGYYSHTNNSIYSESVRMQLEQSPSIQIQSSAMRIRLAAAGIGFFLGMPLREDDLTQNGLIRRILPDLQLYLTAIRSVTAVRDPQQNELLSLVRQEFARDSFFVPGAV